MKINGAVVSSPKPELQSIAKKDEKPSPHISTSENLKEELNELLLGTISFVR